jgi:hypothetical protein
MGFSRVVITPPFALHPILAPEGWSFPYSIFAHYTTPIDLPFCLHSIMYCTFSAAVPATRCAGLQHARLSQRCWTWRPSGIGSIHSAYAIRCTTDLWPGVVSIRPYPFSVWPCHSQHPFSCFSILPRRRSSRLALPVLVYRCAGLQQRELLHRCRTQYPRGICPTQNL